MNRELHYIFHPSFPPRIGYGVNSNGNPITMGSDLHIIHFVDMTISLFRNYGIVAGGWIADVLRQKTDDPEKETIFSSVLYY